MKNRRKLKQVIKERIILSAIIAIVLIVVLASISLFLGIRINFLINDELKINLVPLDKSILLHYNESTVLDFKVTNDNFMFCKSYCEYKLTDLSNNKIIHKSSSLLKSDETTALSYDLTSNLPGSGQIIYQFEARCNNIKSILCNTNEAARFKTSFITFNYDLTEQEKVIKNELNESLHDYMNLLQKSDIKAQENNALLTKLAREKNPEEIILLASIIYDYENEFIKLHELLQKYINLWNEEQYTNLNTEFNLHKITNHLEKSNNLTSAITDVISIHNSNIIAVKSMLDDLDKLNSIHNYYLNINKTTTPLYAYYQNLNNLHQNISQNNFYSYESIKIRILELNESFLDITHNFKTIKEEVLSLGNITTLNLLTESHLLTYNTTINLTNMTIEEPCTEINQLMINLEQIESMLLEQNETLNHRNNTNFTASINSANNYKDIYCDLEDFNNTLTIDTLSSTLIDPLINFNFTSNIDYNIPSNPPQCCIFDECKQCCTHETCSNIENLYPIIFLHGHAINKDESPESSLAIFAKMQIKLQEEGIINAGEISLADNRDEASFGEYGKSGHPVSFRASYYYLNYFDLGRYHITTQKSDRIENYALRLRELIDVIKYRTGFKKVNIVAHSMGGLVARQYIALFGEESVHKLVTIATPHNGTRGKIQQFCNFLGSSPECEDMSADSVFLKRLNAQSTTKKTSNIFTIAGSGCDMPLGKGDGVILVNDAHLTYSKNFQVAGKCSENLRSQLHNRLVDPDKFPEVYEIVKEILEE
jgi:hypothetical protein